MQPPPIRHPARTSAVLFAFFLLVLALVAASWAPLDRADRDIAVSLHHSAVTHHDSTETARVLSDWVWDPWAMRALLAVVVGWLLWRREWLTAGWVAATAALGTLLQQVIKAAVGRERPHWPDPVDSAHYAAFPSGHALTATVACGLVLWVMALHGARARWRWPVAVAGAVSVIGVGLTRLYLGVHWPSDVLGGWLLGAALVYAAVAVYPYAASRDGERTPSDEGNVRS
ncbi:phosphatase PAP2 family protein [Streptomyces sp. NA02950]|uniref:phosphatase PAP2 family protein n=1 Tax=Streptomyces sp. NA02950 TaxID=2742137 RepID=UPI00159241C2|nr:phosphatase PAP2 family protein [Streptomyces sp. NA02950]QKV91453.1 phosphatase PAP2 family protein [Streptomyces sp. NA02950]